jgi:transcriptional regulator with XRE-family HTH domain
MGDRIRKRRLDLKLSQRELAQSFRVDETTIYLWENNRVQPSSAQTPKIIKFLGHDPFEIAAGSLGDRVREYRRVNRLSQKKLAAQLGVVDRQEERQEGRGVYRL